VATTKLWTVEDVAALLGDNYRDTLIRGALYRMPPPGGRHGRIVHVVGRHLGNFIAKHGLGAIYDQSGFIFERHPDTLLGPDLAFVRQDQVPVDDVGYPEVAPDLVVEVVSPSQTGPSIEEKTAIYLAAGVRLVWVIDPERRTLRVHHANGTESLLSEHDEIDGEDVLPGFRLPVARLFA
jgi:Uma2 family endonuclease